MTDMLYHKIIVIGSSGCGKTSIIKRYTGSPFSNNYKATIGVDFVEVSVEVDDQQVHLQLWDIAGQERYGLMKTLYYKKSSAAIVVFDITRKNTFEEAKKWRDDVVEKVALSNGVPVPIMLLANKCDLKTQAIPDQEIEEFSTTNEFFAWFKTSAKENLNISNAMTTLAKHIVKTQVPEPRSEGFHLVDPPQRIKNQRKGGCCN
ncbi:rab7l1 protein [Anaeramoeba ignava]|uniref:Rab7l1 protein n=1 Tax=Anaeramoeba ignava TaxID=1746090 RepID=A0A9Q0LS19_ANAIG|nr:rab7l1 protein [Anaeramoeba ignava]